MVFLALLNYLSMKQIKTFTREQLYIYKSTSGEKLSISLLHYEWPNLPLAECKMGTFSGPTSDYRAPTCIFFTEDVLDADHFGFNFFNLALRPWVPEGEFLKIGFKYGNREYEGWICLGKFNNAPQDAKDILAQNFPQYFSDEPEFRRGFFNENLNEKIDTNWVTNAQIERIMEDNTLSLDDKAHLLFDRTPEHVFDFGMCSYDVPDAVKEIADENGGTIYVDAYNTYLREKGDITVRTVMCLNSVNQPFDLQESWDYYVKQRPCKYESGYRRSSGYSPINWYKYLKAVIETFEDAVKYTNEPNYKRGFFNEQLKEEMEKKVIGSGHGWRIVCRNFQPVSWDRNRYKPGVIVVRLPNSRHSYFMCTPVVTEGVSGQPQLTFDDPAKAQEYCDKLNRISNIRHWEITKTRGNYECYKIPLGGGMEAWLATSNFPSQGSPEWKHLCDLFPDYFKNVTRGFFEESLADGNPSNNEITEIINNDILSDDEVCEKLFGGRNQDYILNACYHHCAYYKGHAPDGAFTPNCYELGVTCPFIISNFSEPTLNIRESYQAYVEGKEFNGESRWSRAAAKDWWADIVKLYTFWEEHDPENFTGPTNHPVRGFFDECLNKEE